MLTLVIASLHSNTTVRPRGIDPAPIVFVKELAPAAAIEKYRHATFDINEREVFVIETWSITTAIDNLDFIGILAALFSRNWSRSPAQSCDRSSR